jgi:hypothetical protein
MTLGVILFDLNFLKDVVDYFDATKDKKFDIPIPPHLFAPIFEDKQKVLQYYTKFVLFHFLTSKGNGIQSN